MTPTRSDVDALFFPEAVNSGEQTSASATQRPFNPTPARCFKCLRQQWGLLTFDTDNCWQPSIALDHPIRDEVRRLRKQHERQSILLCIHCVIDMKEDANANDSTPKGTATEVPLW